MRTFNRTIALAIGAAIGLLATPGAAQLAVEVEASPDVALDLGGETASDHETLLDDTAGSTAVMAYPGLPEGSDIDAHGIDADGNALISIDTTARLPAPRGELTVRPWDVVRLVGDAYQLVLDGREAGLPQGANVDAVHAHGEDLFLSVDVTVRLPDGSVASDEDVLRWDGSELTLYEDVSALGVSGAADLDALQFVETTGALVASFETGGSAGRVVYADDHLLLHDPAIDAWSTAFAGGAAHAAWGPGDVDAASASFDTDGDGIADPQDLCPHFPDPLQSDVDGNGIGDPCECGDQNGDGTVDVLDILEMNQVIFGLVAAGPLCDTNEDGACDVSDILGANARLLGSADAHCSRFPSPVFP